MSEILRFWPMILIAGLMIGLIISFFSGYWIIIIIICGLSAAGFFGIGLLTLSSIPADLILRQKIPATLLSLERGQPNLTQRESRSPNRNLPDTYEVKVRYRYSMAGTEYESQNYGRASVFMSYDDFNELEQRLRSDSLSCYVSKKDPTDAVLSFQWTERLVALFFTVLGGLIFSIPVWMWWKK